MTENQRKAMEEEKYLKMIRNSEDFHDTIDCEKETREDLVEREKMMKKEANYQDIQSNHTLSKKPMHELYKGINKQINNFEKWKDERTPWSGMAGPKRDKR
mgnify:CR=1 FL=1